MGSIPIGSTILGGHSSAGERPFDVRQRARLRSGPSLFTAGRAVASRAPAMRVRLLLA
jgi:hypothetical protein